MLGFRGSITVVTETGQITQSHLVIRNARLSDEGNYTCKPSIFKSAKLRLFVLNGKLKKIWLQFEYFYKFSHPILGDFPAAMHTSSSDQVSTNLNYMFFIGFVLSLL